MGQGCCYPPKDEVNDLRGTNQAKKKGKGPMEQSIFKQQLKEPDFVVTRRDSLGMAAKEHTQGIVVATAAEDARRSIQSSGTGTNTDGGQTVVENKPVFTEGTFAEQNALANIGIEQFEEEEKRYGSDGEEERLPKNSIGCVSFGATNNRVFQMQDSFHEKESARKLDGSNQSIISIRDIQEVRDKVPASPATAVKEIQQDYFQ